MSIFKKNNYHLFFPALIISIFLCGFFISLYVYILASKREKSSLVSRVNTIASLLKPEDIRNLSGSEKDLQTENYVHLKKEFVDILAVNPDIHFIYAMARRNREIIFLVDSEDPTSQDYSPPGQVYFEATPVLNSVFDDGNARLEFASDRWGSWFSAFATVVDADGIVAVIGMDIDKSHYLITIATYTMFPFSVALLLSTFAYTGMKIRKKEHEILDFKGQFITAASHELRSPLSGVRWASEALLKEKNFFTETQQHTIETIHSSSVRILRIIHDLLQIAAIDSRVQLKALFTKCDLVLLLRSVIEEFSINLNEKKIKIILTEKIPDRIPIIGDERQLKQVLGNLISNSIKYSKSDSTITIDYHFENNAHMLSFTDSGIGIPKEDQKKVIQGFYRAKNARNMTVDGTGLGLYLVKKVVELHGGRVAFVSEEGKGSTFFISLPVLK